MKKKAVYHLIFYGSQITEGSVDQNECPDSEDFYRRTSMGFEKKVSNFIVLTLALLCCFSM